MNRQDTCCSATSGAPDAADAPILEGPTSMVLQAKSGLDFSFIRSLAFCTAEAKRPHWSGLFLGRLVLASAQAYEPKHGNER